MAAAKPKALHPRDFTVNRTWLAFRMNQLPVRAGDGEFDIFILQDAASMFIFGNAFAPHGSGSPSAEDVEALLQQAWTRKEEWPDELILPGRPSKENEFIRVAKSHGIRTRAVPEAQMSLYIKDVQESYEEFVERGAAGDA